MKIWAQVSPKLLLGLQSKAGVGRDSHGSTNAAYQSGRVHGAIQRRLWEPWHLNFLIICRLESVCCLNLQILAQVSFAGFQGVVKSTGLSPHQQASLTERVSIKTAARKDFLRRPLGSSLTTWGLKREGCNVLQIIKLPVLACQGWKEEAGTGGNREIWAPCAIFLLRRHVLVVMNSCMFYFYKDDNKHILEWIQKDTLYENKNIIYLILTWIEAWGRKYERPEGKVRHWLQKISNLSYFSFFGNCSRGKKPNTVLRFNICLLDAREQEPQRATQR